MKPCLLPSIVGVTALLLCAGESNAVTPPKLGPTSPPGASSPEEQAPKDISREFDELSRHTTKDGRYYAGYGPNAELSVNPTNQKKREVNPLGWVDQTLTAMDRSNLKVMADYASVTPAAGSFSYVGQGSQSGLISLVPVIKGENGALLCGMAYHYASFYENLPPRMPGGGIWHAIVNRHDFTLLGEYDRPISSGATLFASAGLSLQRHILVLYGEHDYSADDYYASFAPGYEGSAGAEWRLALLKHEVLLRLFVRYMSGTTLPTERLNYDNHSANLNFAAYASGVAAGYAF